MLRGGFMDYYSDIDKQNGHGRKFNQKMKPYIVLQILQKQTDESHYKTVTEIIDILKEQYEMYAERKSVVRDILEINKTLIAIKYDVSLDEAADYYDEFPIVYNPSKKGYALINRNMKTDDVRLLAEIIYSTKFINPNQAKNLVDIVLSNISEYDAALIKHKPFYMERTKTPNDVFANVEVINAAIQSKEKIGFKYMHYDISNLEKQKARRKGEYYVVSPYEMIINDSYYYLLAFDDELKKMRTYRVDRMQQVQSIGEVIDGEEAFEEIDLKTYTKRRFGMFGGAEKDVTIKFNMSLLDTVVDRFGTKDLIYVRLDDHHFSVKLKVDISPQFYAWICGFGKAAQIEYPQEVVDDFKKYLDGIMSKY